MGKEAVKSLIIIIGSDPSLLKSLFEPISEMTVVNSKELLQIKTGKDYRLDKASIYENPSLVKRSPGKIFKERKLAKVEEKARTLRIKELAKPR